MAPAKEFIAIDESGDPGIRGSEKYVLVALHADERALRKIRSHLTAFRYHAGPAGELKGANWAKSGVVNGNGLHRLLEPLSVLAYTQEITVTAIWLEKSKYMSNRGPYLMGNPGESTKFRHFQLRRLLQIHKDCRPWGEAAELVIDRWTMTQDQRADLEQYIRNNYALRPTPIITLVDSIYCDIVQIVDIIGRLVRQCIEDTCTELARELCDRLVTVSEIEGGLYDQK